MVANLRESLNNPGSGRKLALIVGGAVLLLVLVWFFLLKGGGDPVKETGAPAPQATGAIAELPTEGSAEGPGKQGPVETTEVFAPRDPFKPLLQSGTETGGTGDTSGDPTADPTVDPTAGPTADPTADPTGDPTGDGSGNGGETIEGHTVTLVGINGRGDSATAQVQVDDTVYTVQEGETFAENFELVSTSGDCAAVLYGDDQFTICEGEEILK